MEDKNLKFKNLAPTSIEDMSGYKEALDYALNDTKIGNIALTGVYGAGKSSVMKTYEENNSDKKYIHISLANFISKTNSDNNKEFNKRIEAHIINQIIHQIDPDCIPATKFKIKNKGNKAKKRNICNIINLNIFLLSSFTLWQNEILFNSIKYIIPTLNKGVMVAIATILLIVTGGMILSTFCYNQLRNNTVKRINCNGNEIELFDKENDSILDKNLDEFIYILKNSKTDVFVFEDLDRYNDVDIFSKLREVNFILNNQKNMDKVVKFVYLVRDDMFKGNDRTKFFEFILPIVPAIDLNNSKDKMLVVFDKRVLEENKVTERFIDKISYYIDDMRVMTNIYNEFLVYSTQIKKDDRKLNSEKLLGIITYKNIFPNDFAKLQKNEGYVSNIFKKKEIYIKNKIGLLNEEILKNKKIIKELEISIENTEAELIAIFLKGNRIYKSELEKSNIDIAKELIEMNDNDSIYIEHKRGSNSKRKFEIWKELNENSEFIRRKQNLDGEEKGERIKHIKEKIKVLENKIEEIRREQVYKMIDKLEDVFNYENEEFAYLKENVKYIGLIRLLILDGYIDELYWEYMGYFYPNSLTIKDQNFKISVFEGRKLPYDYELDRIELLIEYFQESDFTREAILNYDLFSKMLNDSTTEKLYKFLENILKRDKIDFLQGFFERGEKFDLFIKYFNFKFGQLSKIFITDERTTKEFKIAYIQGSLLNSREFFVEINKGDVLSDYLSKSPYVFDNLCQEKEEFFIDSLTLLNTKLENLGVCDGLSIKAVKKITVNKIYQMNIENIIYLIKVLTDECIDSKVYKRNYSILNSSENLKEVLEYVNENIDSYIESNLEFLREGDSFTNNEKEVLKLLEMISNLELKETFMIKSEVSINKIDCIEEELWDLLITNNKLKATYYNALIYTEKKGLTDEIINFINEFEEESFDETLNYEIFSNSDYEKSEEDFILSTKIKNSVYEKICEKIQWCFTKFEEISLPVEQIKILIRTNIIKMNAFNYTQLSDSHNECIVEFIIINFDEFEKLVVASEIKIDKSILTKLLNNKNIESDKRINILKMYDKPISLKDIFEAEKLVQEFVLENNFDTNDIGYLISNYPRMENILFKEKFILKLENFVDSWDFEASDYVLIFDFMRNTEIEIGTKYNLLLDIINVDFSESENLNLISEIIEELTVEEIKFIFENLRIQEFMDLFNNKKPKFNKNKSVKKLLDLLKKKQIVGTVKEEEECYRAYSRKI